MGDFSCKSMTALLFILFFLLKPSAQSCRVHSHSFLSMNAHVAQLGERQTEDLKVLGSIPSVGSAALVAQFGRAWV